MKTLFCIFAASALLGAGCASDDEYRGSAPRDGYYDHGHYRGDETWTGNDARRMGPERDYPPRSR